MAKQPEEFCFSCHTWMKPKLLKQHPYVICRHCHSQETYPAAEMGEESLKFANQKR